MEKAAKILLIISIITDVVFMVVSTGATLVGGSLNPVGTTDGTVYLVAIISRLVTYGVPFLLKVILFVIIVFTMKGKSENIVTEIFAIILFSGIGMIFQNGTSAIGNMIVGGLGAEDLAGFSYMNMAASWCVFLHYVSNTLLLVGSAFSIAFKKVELTDIRRIQAEEE